MKQKISATLYLIGFVVLFACINCCKPSPKYAWNGENYVAHVQLDSTVLLITELANELEVPWDLEPGPNNWLYFTEQKGTVNRIHTQTREIQQLSILEDVFYRRSTGLFSMALHPDFLQYPYLYLHYTTSKKDSALIDQITSKIVRYSIKNNQLKEATVLLDNIGGNTYHNGSRMLIHEDKLWLGTGDAGATQTTQDYNTLNGKVIRINLDGSIPVDNPFPNSPVWSIGHRNIQGITTGKGKIYVSEHGPITDDEINHIEKSRNYGWPNVHGFCDLENEKVYCQDSLIQEPLKAWSPTIATSGLEYYNHNQVPEWKNSLLLTTLKGQSLRVLPLSEDGNTIISEKLFLQKFLGRLRDVAINSTGEIYLATSNMDWHQGHQPWLYDSLPKKQGDRILKIQVANSQILEQLSAIKHTKILKEETVQIPLGSEKWGTATSEEELSKGKNLYLVQCSACHRPDGKGNIGEVPPLINSDWVSGYINRLINITLTGLHKPIVVNGIEYNGEMPGYQHLADEDIKDILNYIRTEFGKKPGTIRTADILHQRKEL